MTKAKRTLLVHFPSVLSVVGPLSLTGPRDGDTIEVAGERIHLHGIDAPESGQKCRRLGHAQVWLYCGRQLSQHQTPSAL